MAMMPTTTPAAMPALLLPPPLDAFLAELEAVTTIVCPALVMTEGAAVWVTVGIWDDDDEPDPAGALPTLLSMPVRATDQKPSPPQSAVS